MSARKQLIESARQTLAGKAGAREELANSLVSDGMDRSEVDSYIDSYLEDLRSGADPEKMTVAPIESVTPRTPEDLSDNVSIDHLVELGFLGANTERSSRNVKSSTTRYRNALKKSEDFLRSEQAAAEGRTVTARADLGERPIVKPEDLEDTVLVSHKGDVTDTDVALIELDGFVLPEPVVSFGGGRFGDAKRNREAGLYWASMKGAATPLQNKAEVLEQVYEMPVSAIYQSMGREGNFFNQALADAMLQRTQAVGVSDAVLDKFDEELRALLKRDKDLVSDWVGIRSPEARAQLLGVGQFPMEGAGKLRGLFMKVASKAEYRNEGFASLGSIEKAFVAPDLVTARLGESGYSIGRIGSDYGLTAIDTHPSYNTGIKGLYLGGFDRQVPVEILFPDAWKVVSKELTKPKSGGKPRPLTYSEMADALAKRKDLFQIADARWVDSVSKWMEENNTKDMKAAISAIGLPLAAIMMLDPRQAQAEAIEAVYASTERDLTDEEIRSIQTYIQMENAYAAVNGPVPPPEVYKSTDMPTEIVEKAYDPGFANDDAAGQYIADRQEVTLTPAQKADLEMLAQQKPQDTGNIFADIPAQAERFAKEYTIPALKDLAKGSIEIPTQVVAGFLDATAEAARVMESIIPLGTISGAEPEYIEIEADPRTVTGAGVRAISQFLTGFIPALRGIKALGVTGVAAPAAAGAIADATVFDPQEDRLSNLIQEVPALENPITEYLAASPEDTDAEGRFKNAVEGLVLGGIVDSLVQGIRLVKSRRALVEVAEAEGKPVEQMIDEAMATMKGGEPYIEPALRDRMPPGQEFIPFNESAEASQPTIQLDLTFKQGSTRAGEEAAKNINLANLDTPEHVDDLIDMVAENDAPRINEERRQTITNQELPKLASDLGMTVEDLLARRRGEAFNAEQILAARKILVASGKNLINLAQKAKTGSEMDLALFRRATAQHRAIQAQVSGMTAEAGRALQSFRIVAQSDKEQERLIKEALETSGGEQISRRMAQLMSELDSEEQIGAFVKEAHKATTSDMLYEAWINGLLSSPKTHIVNAASNVLVAGFSVAERRVASIYSSEIKPGESEAQLKGMIDGARDGFRLAWNALKSGEATDPMGKIEAEKHRAITAENLNLSGFPGRFVDFLGSAVRIPGRLLTASDEFFKSVGYRMELHAQAYRQAFQEGLEGEKLAKRVQSIIENPPEFIHRASVDAMRYQTFTNSLSETKIRGIAELGELGEAVRGKQSIGPYARIIVPFVRTPTNVASYTFERTPLAFASKSVRNELNAGGIRRDMALAKIITGSTAMAVAADLAIGGHVTGSGPTNRDMRNLMRATGWQPYSIKIGDTYYAYNRLDPIGSLLGLAADMTEIMGQVDGADADKLAAAAAISVSQNFASKTYLSGVSEFFDAFFSSSTDPEASNYKMRRYLQRMFSSIVPRSVANVEQAMSPEMSATYGFMDSLKANIPGYSDDMPPRRNIFGEVVVLSGGLGPDIMSPIYTSEEKDDPIANEMIAQSAAVGMPRRSIEGVELDAEQYDRYIIYYSGVDSSDGMSLRNELKKMINSSAYRNATDGPEGYKRQMIESVFIDARERAKSLMLRSDTNLRRAVDAMNREKRKAELGY